MPTSPPNHSRYSLHQEIAALRTAIRSARRALRKGTADPVKTILAITRSSNTLVSLLQTQRELDDQQRHREQVAAMRHDPSLAAIFNPRKHSLAELANSLGDPFAPQSPINADQDASSSALDNPVSP